MKLEDEAAKLAATAVRAGTAGEMLVALSAVALARDFALAVLRKAEEMRGVRLTALEKATVIDRAAGDA